VRDPKTNGAAAAPSTTTIHRAPHDVDNPFTRVSNFLINDRTISPEAGMIAVWMLSKPDDWIFHRSHVEREFGLSKYVVARIFAELEQAGYVVASSQRRKGCRFDAAQIEMFEIPSLSVTLVRPDAGSAETRPWTAAGVSRATWYRKKRDEHGTSSVGQKLDPGETPHSTERVSRSASGNPRGIASLTVGQFFVDEELTTTNNSLSPKAGLQEEEVSRGIIKGGEGVSPKRHTRLIRDDDPPPW
jgi:hypothetical protein